MPRVRAADYEEKRDHVIEVAARLFAERGYSNTTMGEVAQACGSSKAKAYYYFPKKNELLFTILEDYCQEIIAACREIDEGQGSDTEKLKAFIIYYVACAPTMRNRHVLMAKDLHFLTHDEQQIIKAYSRELADLLAGMVLRVNPVLDKRAALPRTSSFLLFGMLNNIHHWYKDSGAISVEELGDIAADIFIEGLTSLKPERFS